MKTYVVIGMGRFGTAVATRLYELGNEVLIIDMRTDCIQHIADRVTHAVTGDATDEDVLRALGVGNYDCAIVSIGSDLAASILVTLNLKDLGVPAVICKASDEGYKRALERVGADRVVIPEREMGVKLAQNLTSSSILDFIELSPDYGIAELSVPADWVGKSLRELNIRAKYGVTVLAFRKEDRLNVQPGPEEPVGPGTVAIVLGSNEQLSRLQAS